MEYSLNYPLLRAIPSQAQKKQLPKVQLCSAKAGATAIRRGEQAWFVMLRAPDTACSRGVDSTQGDGTVVHDQQNNPAFVSKWQALLTEYANVFEQPGEPVSRPVDHCIDLLDPNAMLPKSRLYRILEDKLNAVKDTINNYLAYGWIRPSTGSYGAPVIVIQKKTGGLRIFIDYWLLNKQTRLDSYPIPRIDELLDRIISAKYFSKIDLASGYHQIKMADGHEEKTAFLTRYSTYEWVVLAQDLKMHLQPFRGQ